MAGCCPDDCQSAHQTSLTVPWFFVELFELTKFYFLSRKHAAHGSNFVTVLIACGGQRVVVPEQLVCSVDKVNVQIGPDSSVLANSTYPASLIEWRAGSAGMTMSAPFETA